MYYEVLGDPSPTAETVVLSAGLGGSGSFWQPQLAALAAGRRVILYDHNGTGRSGGTLAPGYRMADMAAELAALLQRLEVQRCHLVGHALGGIIGLQLALDYPGLLHSLVVVNGWPVLDSQTRRCFNVRRDLLLNSGVEAYVRAQPLFLYPADWLSQHEALLEQEQAHQVAHFQGMENLLHRLEALMAADLRARLPALEAPVLALCARDDLLVPYPCSAALAAALPQGHYQEMAYGGHAMSVTDPETFTSLLLAWLKRHPMEPV
ncbi:pyrimidine utilization protein D [Chimaeribacter arupi]|uniref:pyrimidine utilization protein D n=1 Tax=Chimaeribacter arupi TaxID=2060066 RepID=UPI000C7C0B54|nr:pyrimidine utilization protein D [Chimaeribacter arupi]MDV5141270.1 pyrimidine utilization protein D [Chimaeribacter arupi]PLR49226.1 pyrimidine utilization protein D [Chimaeribacter arupi]PLR54134.1 pyrimidine utilization protein D [Chimaeribacter arupi]